MDIIKKQDFDIDTNAALVQVCGGFIRRVSAGYRFAMKTYSGSVRVYSSPFVVRWPATEAKLICISRLKREIIYSDPIKTTDDITVTCATPIGYHFRVGDDAKSIRKIFNEVEADNRIKDIVKDIIDLVAKNSPSDRIKGKISISATNIPDWIKDSKIRTLILDDFLKIKQLYGVIIENIFDIDFNEPKEILDAQTDAKAQHIRNKTAIDKAEAEFDIERRRAQNNAYIGSIQAQIDYIKKQYDYRALYEAVTAYGLNTDQICDILRRQFTQTNTTIIETNGGFDSLATAILAGLKAYSIQQRNISDEKTDASNDKTESSSSVPETDDVVKPNDDYIGIDQDGVIDVNYTDTDEKGKGLK